ncbi:MAG: glycine oxidase ThiO [Solirubrobacteraceae bacterium MAG38_C4-C5]|nr:glycine oxidase ThiO [Candidatus Siliceabacter maunaloa]
MPAKRDHTPTDTFDVLVAGGGVAGLVAAWRAAQAGRAVCLVDRGELGAGASHVAAGMLAPVTEADPREPALLELGLEAAWRWPGFAEELESAAGMGVALRRTGSLVVARDRDEAEALDRVREVAAGLGVTMERLLPSAARRLEPALAPTVRLALHAPDDHSVDPRLITAALAEAARRAGAVLRCGEEVGEALIDGAVVSNGREPTADGDRPRITGLRLTSGERLTATDTVVALGAWAGDLPGLPSAARVPMRPVKGQLLRLRDPEGPGLIERTVRFEGGYLVPRADGRYVLGATQEERGFDTTVTAGGLYELLRDASELVPGVLELELEEAIAGLRPATPDNAPVLGRPRGVDGLIWAGGHHRNGVLLAPVTGDAVLRALDGEPAAPAFAPARFAHADAEALA